MTAPGAEGLLWRAGPRALLGWQHAAGQLPSSARDRWLTAVALGAVGRYAEAGRMLSGCPGSLPLSTLASHARQTGRPGEADRLDASALACARTPEARADAAAGLVADAVGRGEAAAATRRLPAAARAARGAGWRAQVRLGWVRAEVALLTGRDAAPAAAAALAAARAARAPRHVAKSLLFSGVAAGPRGLPEVRRALQLATVLGLPTLIWPAALVLANRGEPAGGLAREAVRAVLDGLPAGHAETFAARPEVAAVLSDRGPGRAGSSHPAPGLHPARPAADGAG